MSKPIKILATNRLANSEHYGKILSEYNSRLTTDGRVNNKKFFEEVVSVLIPGYTMSAWYQFVNKFKSAGGLIAAQVLAKPAVNAVGEERIMMSNAVATSTLVQTLLNVAAERAQELVLHPEMLTHKEAMELGLKTMKAQDSRIHAVGKLREDNRAQEKFDRAFSDAASE